MDTKSELQTKMAALDELSRERWRSDPGFRAEVAQEIAKSVYLGFSSESMIDLVAEVERVNLGDRVFERELEGLLAFWTARGGYIESSELTETEYELRPDMLGIRVKEHEDTLVTRLGEGAQKLKTHAVRQLDGAVNQRFTSLLRAATPSSNANSNYVAAASVTLPTVRAALTQVADESESGDIAIIGRAQMTHQVMNALQDSGFFLPSTAEEINRTGILGTFNGAKIITVKNVRGQNPTQLIPSNELYIASKDAARVAFYGGIQAKEASDMNWYWEAVMRMDVGMLVHHPGRVFRILDNA